MNADQAARGYAVRANGTEVKALSPNEMMQREFAPKTKGGAKPGGDAEGWCSLNGK